MYFLSHLGDIHAHKPCHNSGSHWPLTVKACLQSWASLHEIHDGQSGMGTGFPLSISLHQCSIVIFIYMLLLPDGQTGKACKTATKQCCFGDQGALDIKLHFFHASEG